MRARTEERDGRLQLFTGRKTWLTFAQPVERYVERMESGGGRNLAVSAATSNSTSSPRSARSGRTAYRVLRQQLQAGSHEGGSGGRPSQIASWRPSSTCCVTRLGEDMRAVLCTFKLLPEPPGRRTVSSEAEASALMAEAVLDQQPATWLFVAFGLAMRHATRSIGVGVGCTSARPRLAPGSNRLLRA